MVKRMVQLKHYSPRAADDSFSVSVFNTILNTADPRRLLFTNAEYQQLLAFRTSLDDELEGKIWKFFDLFSKLYRNGLLRADSIINTTLKQAPDYNAAESLGQTKKKDEFSFAADNAALYNRWSRYLKFMILRDAFDELYENDSIPAGQSLKTILAKQEPVIREKIKKAELKSLKRVLDNPDGFSAMTTELYLNSIASCFDPHTNYFSPEGKEELQAALSTEAYFFGIVFNENDKGNIVVDKLTPGGPAWKSGAINKGDELLSLVWEGKEVQDMEGASQEEVNEVLDQSVHDKMIFRFRKADGTTSQVMLRKEKLENEDNIVKGFILKGEKKIGYIVLPGFYTEWENETGSRCANDVAREILKLKRENIDGLILDVRNNGGGSIGEALDMAGIFIDEGPLAAMREKDGKLVTLKDPNRGTIYDGPLALMVNGQSASASEMLAASLQDYNRAIITGSNTYGKATMQQMYPLDTISNRTITGNEKGDIIKITTGKLFRINGKTAQFKGVMPDILLPDAFDGLDIGERFEKYALTADTVKRNNYYKPLPYLPVSELAARSKTRLGTNEEFSLIQKIAAEQIKYMQQTTRTIPLKTEQFEKWMQTQQVELKAMKGEGKATVIYTPANHQGDAENMKGNSYAKEMNDAWLLNLAEDIYIQETFRVLTDLINLQVAAGKK